jgi:hypothetical protein
MAVRKRSITFDKTVLAEAERLCAQRDVDLSTFVNAAVERWLKVERGQTSLPG